MLSLILMLVSSRWASAQGLVAPDPARFDQTLVERAGANQLLAESARLNNVDAKVARLIERLILDDHAKVQAAVTALVELGPEAVPAIIRRIDDRREYKVRAISFVNKFPGAFEGVRHYGAEKVIDALNLILNDIAGVDFGQIDQPEMGFPPGDGSPADIVWRQRTESQRNAVVVAARQYLARLSMMPPVPVKSLPKVPS